jgi:hypothetical protein
MATGRERLVKDLKIVEEIAVQMKDYLASEEVFWQRISDDELQPTIGGFLLRQHRLLALEDYLLDDSERLRLQAVIKKFEEAVTDQPRRFETKARQELEVRTQQWAKALQELLEDEAPSLAYYRADVQTRATITALSERLASIPNAVAEKIEALDKLLRQHWQTGEFIWPPEWKPAYPAQVYWWLYGKLKNA